MTGETDETLDSILGGAIQVVQPRRGYRFSIDSLLLARFATVHTRDRVLELGAGCGVISLIIAAIARPRKVVSVEIQPQLAEIAQRNVALNQLENIEVVHADIRTRMIPGIASGGFDLVVANPPFHALRTGRESPDDGRRIARGESSAALVDFIAAARRYARNGARVAFLFAASRTVELLTTLRANGLEPKRIRYVHSRAELPASSVMVEARAAGGVEAVIEAPLVVWHQPGVYTEEVRVMLESH